MSCNITQHQSLNGSFSQECMSIWQLRHELEEEGSDSYTNNGPMVQTTGVETNGSNNFIYNGNNHPDNTSITQRRYNRNNNSDSTVIRSIDSARVTSSPSFETEDSYIAPTDDPTIDRELSNVTTNIIANYQTSLSQDTDEDNFGANTEDLNSNPYNIQQNLNSTTTDQTNPITNFSESNLDDSGIYASSNDNIIPIQRSVVVEPTEINESLRMPITTIAKNWDYAIDAKTNRIYNEYLRIDKMKKYRRIKPTPSSIKRISPPVYIRQVRACGLLNADNDMTPGPSTSLLTSNNICNNYNSSVPLKQDVEGYTGLNDKIQSLSLDQQERPLKFVKNGFFKSFFMTKQKSSNGLVFWKSPNFNSTISGGQDSIDEETEEDLNNENNR